MAIFKGKKAKKEIEIKNFAKIPQVMELPNLIEIQKKSYEWFLQEQLPPAERDYEAGLQSVFKTTFPIESPNDDIVLDFVSYAFGESKYNELQAKEKGLTYAIPLKAVIRLIYKNTGEVREKEIFMGDIPKMTKRGTFIINGAERVVVSQIHKSPGVVFAYDDKKKLFNAKIIPDKGAWLEFELDIKKELLYIKIDRKKNVLVTNLLRAIGYETNADIISLFYSTDDIDLNKQKDIFETAGEPIRIAQDIVTDENAEHPVYTAGMEINIGDAEKIQTLGFSKIKIISQEQLKDDKTIIKCLEKDDSKDKADAISKLHSVTRPGEPTTLENAEREFQRLFSDPKKYDLGRVGRYKFNQKLYSKDKKEKKQIPGERTLSAEDIIRTIKYLLKVYSGEEDVDDIDHLGNRRIRCVGELLVNQLKTGFARMERAVKERMNTEDINEITPQKLISIKPITAIIKEFFGSSQLSQFMDQTNPLAELTHKRRLNALGMGGLSRERAGFEVRDVHHTHYGRMCPIETPEGPNIGLILSLSTFARVNDYGFLETPYRKVDDGKISDEIDYLTAIEEENYNIAMANTEVDDRNRFVENFIAARNKGKYPIVPPNQVDYIDVSPKQIISVSTALIPFLEHDDANRALMGSNMQRQAVPLLNCKAPVVGTGMERKAAMDSGVCMLSEHDGEVVKVDNTTIDIKVSRNQTETYVLQKYNRTNQNTCFTQKPLVNVGDKVKIGDLLADGPACKEGELALGRNLLVAFMTWDGYNYEDAILISEKVVKHDVFTSIHIEEFEVEARETKLGSESITRDIPNLGEEALKNLDEFGVIRVGARVSSGDILVGKVTPKGETDLTPEYKLLHSIFGEKAREVKDTSLKVPHGNGGIVIGTNKFSRSAGDDLSPGVEETIKVFIAKKRKLSEGDKLAGRHGNKGVISRIVPEEDMPFLPDGTPLDIVLNPLGVPSRMNLGQILETHLGWAAKSQNMRYYCPVFDSATLEEIQEELSKSGLNVNGKSILYDGRTGIPLENEITVGYMYILKLNHLVDDKMHARSTGPYSLVTQQPLGGKAQFGGQRLGEMEVWALEAYGAANTLQEFLTTKSDDMMGRAKIYENIVKGEYAESPGIPESFNVLVQELRGLALDLQIYDKNGKQLALTDKDDEILSKKNRTI